MHQPLALDSADAIVRQAELHDAFVGVLVREVAADLVELLERLRFAKAAIVDEADTDTCPDAIVERLSNRLGRPFVKPAVVDGDIETAL
jgi:hypothetical protein